MAVRYKVGYAVIGILTAVMLLASNNVYADSIARDFAIYMAIMP
ncbi:MAG: hypothetical protein ACK4FV_01930 [Candidatus Nitrosocaldus sp.]